MSFTVTTTGYPNASLTETGALPTGLSFTANANGTATISGTPAAGTGGSSTISLQATNSAGSVTQSFVLVVGQAPAITSPGTATATVGTAMSFTVTTTGFPKATITETGALPTGLSFTANANGTATISGTPAAGTGGSSTITLKATNSAGSATQSFVLLVDQAPAITSPGTATATVGKTFTFAVTTTGFPKATITETGVLPTGLSFTANANGMATISGTPAVGTGGSSTITLKATNSTGSATQSFVLVVDQAPAITSSATATATVGTAMSFTVTTTGFPKATITESGTLPKGISFTTNANGTASISGTPAAGTGGSYTIGLQATNSAGSATQSFVLVVDQAPAITSSATASATVGKAMKFSVTTTGFPKATITESGTVPKGLSFTANTNGTATISGTPAAGTAGVHVLTITAANGVGSAAIQIFTLTIRR